MLFHRFFVSEHCLLIIFDHVEQGRPSSQRNRGKEYGVALPDCRASLVAVMVLAALEEGGWGYRFGKGISQLSLRLPLHELG